MPMIDKDALLALLKTWDLLGLWSSQWDVCGDRMKGTQDRYQAITTQVFLEDHQRANPHREVSLQVAASFQVVYMEEVVVLVVCVCECASVPCYCRRILALTQDTNQQCCSKQKAEK